MRSYKDPTKFHDFQSMKVAKYYHNFPTTRLL